MQRYLQQLISSRLCVLLTAFVLAGSVLMAPTPMQAQGSMSARTLQAASTTQPAVLSPQFLVIPKLSVANIVEPVGRTDDGKMKTPDNWRNTGWYEPGVKPGEDGHAVFAAHRDWDGNRGPFYDLPSLVAGDNIFIAGDEAIHVYTVTKSNSFARTADPASVIFNGNDTPKITLISCEGDFVDTVGTYDQRRVVQAELTYTFQ